MRRPSFQFYPADWQGNSNLRRCTLEERGAWMEVLCLMHDSSSQYGVLPWPIKQIAQAAGCKPSILFALVDKQVLKGADPGDMCEAFVYTPRHSRQDGEPVTLIPSQPGPLWYSSRMVRDEYIKLHSGAATRFKPADDPSPNYSPSRGQGEEQGEYQGDGSSLSTSTSLSVLKEKADPSLRSDPAARKENLPQVDPVLMALPCMKGKFYHITQAMLDRWASAFPSIDPLAEARRMKFWLEENTTRQKTYQGMGKFFSTWLGNATDRLKEQGRSSHAPANKPRTQAQITRDQQAADYMAANPDHFNGSDDVPFG